jgi:serine/threonine-protein kinase HipA
MNKCLFCYCPLENEEYEYHADCSRKIFAAYPPPELFYSDDQIFDLANQVVKSQFAITGVQPKLSLEIEKPLKSARAQRFTIVGLWGNYIFKPQSPEYPNLPEIEDLTMHLAEISEIATVPHSLIRMKNGSLAYITRRIDRQKNSKLFMEDMCQLTERLTEHKYSGSYENIAKAILRYSTNPVLDAINFFEQLVFSFLVGNADMHLKNFSLYGESISKYGLTPSYDMVSTALILNDKDELALTLNGKKNNLQKLDFVTTFRKFIGNEKSIENIFTKFSKSILKYETFINISFIPDDKKEKLISIIHERSRRIFK